MILRELVAKYDLKFNDRPFKKADQTIGNTMDKLKQLGGLLLGGAAAKGVYNFIDGMRDLGDQIDKASFALGVNRQALQEWEYVAGLGGVSMRELQVSFRTLQRGAAEAADGIATYKDEFDRMGISVKDSNGQLKTADQLMLEMADGLNNLESDTQKVATAQQLMGRSGAKMLAVFANGRAGVEKFRQEARELGGVLGDETVDGAVELTDNLWRFEFAMRGIRATIANILMPMVDWIARGMSSAVKAFRRATEGTNAVKHALQLLGLAAIALGVKLLIPFAPALLAFAKLAIVIMAVYLVFDDLMTLFAGGDSVIGRMIDSLFGPGSATEAVNYLKEAGEGMKLAYQNEVWPAMEEVGKNLYELFNDTAEQADKQGLAMERNLESAHGWVGFVKDWKAGVVLLEEAWSDFLNTWVQGFERVAQAAVRLSEKLSKIPGVETLAKAFLHPTGRTAGGEARTYRQGLGGGAGGPAAAPDNQLPAPLSPAQGSTPRTPAQRPSEGGVVEANTNLNLTIQAPPGSDANTIARETEAVVRRTLREERRKTAAAVRQRYIPGTSEGGL